MEAGQVRLAQLEAEYQARIEHLQRQLSVAKNALCHYAAGHNGTGPHLVDNKDEILSLPDSTGSGEQNSTAASDLSWEQIEERDANMTLWVPDHAVTHCAGCDCEFWMVRRKHHCRNCGRVFCSDCTNYFTAVPHQHLDVPVRVCRQCFLLLSNEDALLATPTSSDVALSPPAGIV